MKLQFIPNLWHTWEVSASCSQGISHWGHGQHNVEIVGTLVNKVLPDHFFNMRTTCSCSLLTNLIKEKILQYSTASRMLKEFFVILIRAKFASLCSKNTAEME